MKIKGQVFLKNKNCYKLSFILLKKNSKILELASGYLNFTRFLRNKTSSKIVSIDVDNKFICELNENIINLNFRILGRVILIGNIPYNISTKIIYLIKKYNTVFIKKYIMLQSEFLNKKITHSKNIFIINKFFKFDFVKKIKVNSFFLEFL
ncbi:rRNA adenine N-6-methyltransferase family protein [Candidatus Vidania fulgoroideorum]